MAPMLLTIFFASLVGVDSIVPSDKIPTYLAKYDIPVEEHFVTTDDGYILATFRLSRPGSPVVVFVHGILSSAWCWIDNDPAISPAIQVYNLGYDVWLTNSRGNTFSSKHVSLNPTFNEQFWNFSFPEIGRYDIPANINHILNATSKKTLSLVGHSQGTSAIISAMTDPTTKGLFESRVNLFVAMSPVTYLSHQRALLLKTAVDLDLGLLLMRTYPFGFLKFAGVDTVAHLLCTATKGIICSISVDVVCGDSQEDTSGAITNISAHFPAGTSVKALDHYEQLIKSGKFQDYDYGHPGNNEMYGSDSPQVFTLSAVKVPTALFVGDEDDLGDVSDAKQLELELPKSTTVFSQTFPGYSHITWIAGTWASFQAWFPQFKSLLVAHNPLQDEIVV
eukprot:TRINITY_DN24246_c0_g1_i1.p1 TRINITY_DN24246_c0_g1~~TRINITY_DN24246_c0_g1_i1.p1  ORF type:complete len:392 (-),score=55.21 TRINITY_DN24246_c0_g1_i1:127-1302(-)